MKRALLTQIKNEWRENIWLVIELLIIMLAVWYVSLNLLQTGIQYCEPKGFEADDVYYMMVKRLDKENPNFIDFGEESNVKEGETLLYLLNRIKKNPHVEAAALSQNALPYNFSYMGSVIDLLDNDSIKLYVNRRVASPEIVKILKIKSLNGLSEDDMVELLRKGEVLLSSYKEFDKYRDIRKFLGRPIYLYGDSVNAFTSHGLMESIRRSEFESGGGTMLIPLSDEAILSGAAPNVWEIAVRVRPGEGTAFVNDIRNNPGMCSHLNVTLSLPKSLVKTRESATRQPMIEIRMMTGISVLLLFIVFLGLFGTFWYRIRRRESETAIRMVNGATRRDIFRRFISEGLLLTSVSALLAIGFGILYYHKQEYRPDDLVLHIVISGIMAFAIICVVVSAGIIIPARRAMKLDPATALKDE